MTSQPLRVLFLGQRWDYGDEARGASFEYTNFFDALGSMPDVDARFFDFMGPSRAGGGAAVSRELLAAIDGFDPDLLFCMLFEDEVPAELLADLRDRPRPHTYNWFCDDHWRFDSFTSRYAPLFNSVSTTDRAALPRYAEIGLPDVLFTQWGCNPNLYAPTGRPVRHDVTFVGQSYGDRPWLMRHLRRKGVPIEAWGAGFPNGRLEFADMIAVFAESKVNVNLTRASNNTNLPRVVRGGLNRIYPPAVGWFGKGLDQIKGRTFEIPACGGFQLSGAPPGIEDYFVPGEEIALFRSNAELVEQAGRYLRDDAARVAVAEAGLRRVLAEHTYPHRFRALFRAMELMP